MEVAELKSTLHMSWACPKSQSNPMHQNTISNLILWVREVRDENLNICKLPKYQTAEEEFKDRTLLAVTFLKPVYDVPMSRTDSSK